MALVAPGSRCIVRSLIVAHALLVMSACRQGPQAAASEQETIASNHVFAACLMKNYSGTPLADEADIWAQGLVESGNLPADSYPGLAALANRSPEPAQSQNGTMMRMQSCRILLDDPQVVAEIHRLVQP